MSIFTRSVVVLSTVFVLFALCVNIAIAEVSTSVCTSFNPENIDDPWGRVGTLSPELMSSNCPRDHAFFAVTAPGGAHREGSKISIYGSCCPLPDGMLLDEHRFEAVECPAGYVATGAKQEKTIENETTEPKYRKDSTFWSNSRLQYMRCTRLNPERFTTSEIHSGIRVGIYFGFRTYFEKQTTRSALPPALRYGLGRGSRASWFHGTCVSFPWGGVLMKKESKLCGGFGFSQIVYTGAPGDPERGTPVKLFPDCLAIDSPLSANPRCVTD